MVRIVVFEGYLEFLDAQTAFHILFKDDKFVKRFHKEANNDPLTQVSEWNSEGKREVNFSASIMGPKFLQTLLVSSRVTVKETQQFMKQGDAFIIKSEPILQVPGGERFHASGDLTLSPHPRGWGCQIKMRVKMEFNPGLWGIKAPVESFMESHARKTFAKWLRIAQAFCEEEVQISRSLMAEEQYFDAPEFAAEHPSIPKRAFEINATEAGRGCMSSLAESALNELNGLHSCSQASRLHLEKMNWRLQKVQEDVNALLMCVQKQGRALLHTTWTFMALGLVLGFLFGSRHVSR